MMLLSSRNSSMGHAVERSREDSFILNSSFSQKARTAKQTTLTVLSFLFFSSRFFSLSKHSHKIEVHYAIPVLHEYQHMPLPALGLHEMETPFFTCKQSSASTWNAVGTVNRLFCIHVTFTVHMAFAFTVGCKKR